MPKKYVTIIGKSVRSISRLRGGGSALPGLVVEKIDSEFISHTLSQIPRGVVIVSGTNGKTTTTKMVVELLEGQGLKVFTNRTGSNFSRGVAAALLGEIDINGKLDADIAVLELDEAHAVNFVSKIPPTFSLLLNVMRDQLDRFGEIDSTAKMLEIIAAKTTGGVVLNREDPRIAKIGKSLGSKKISFFGLDKSLQKHFPNDDEFRGGQVLTSVHGENDVVLRSLDGQSAKFSIGTKTVSADLKLQGIYNVFNAAAAISLVQMIVGEDTDKTALIKSLSNVAPAFGRGETLELDGQPIELVLVKNPSGFRLGLKSFSPEGYATMIAVNDNYADGRDMSWLWDVDFDSLKKTGVNFVSGIRAFDMALRLQYDEIEIAFVEPNLKKALASFIKLNKDSPKRIFCTYTAMLALRREISKMTEVEQIS